MTTEQLKDFLSARPFRPFIINTADGKEIEVNHPETIAYGGGRTAVVYVSDDRFVVVDLLLVPTLEVKGGVA